jgi:hypothetical protein
LVALINQHLAKAFSIAPKGRGNENLLPFPGNTMSQVSDLPSAGYDRRCIPACPLELP